MGPRPFIGPSVLRRAECTIHRRLCKRSRRVPLRWFAQSRLDVYRGCRLGAAHQIVASRARPAAPVDLRSSVAAIVPKPAATDAPWRRPSERGRARWRGTGTVIPSRCNEPLPSQTGQDRAQFNGFSVRARKRFQRWPTPVAAAAEGPARAAAAVTRQGTIAFQDLGEAPSRCGRAQSTGSWRAPS